MYKRVSLIIGLLLFYSSYLIADVIVPVIFGDNMVIQNNSPVKIWGTADVGEEVKVSIDGQNKNTVADLNGKWFIVLNPIKEKGPYTMTIEGKNKIVMNNILAGEVWLCSGQSNMWWPVNRTKNASNEINNANYPLIRLFTIKKNFSSRPLDKVEGQWLECFPQTVKSFSAVAYFFGRELYTKLNVPIGLINSSVGGSTIETWMSYEAIESDVEIKQILDKYESYIGKLKPSTQVLPKFFLELQDVPTLLFNATIFPITSFSIKGVIWYQGERNINNAYKYRKLFPAMIKDWRKKWNIGEFPFLFVQLPNFMRREPQPTNSSLAELREAQLMTLSVENTAMAVTIDIGEGDKHPINKQDIGLRLALSALAKVYGKDIVYSGPIYKSMKIEGNKIIILFDYIGGGLITLDSNELKGFSIAGENKKFYWAKAVIEGDTVIVSSENVANPVAVRYAWGDNPECNLYNKSGLPASPFRTDILK